MMELKSAAFQSMFQLSVALNLGFLAYVTIFGNDLQKEKENTDRLRQIAIKYKRTIKQSGIDDPEAQDLIRKVEDLRRDISGSLKWMSFITHKIFKPLVLVISVLSLCFLAISTFYGDSDSGHIFALSSIAFFIPLLVYLAVLAFFSITIASGYSKRRQELDEKLGDGLLTLASVG